MPLKGGDVLPLLSIYLTSSPINLAEKAFLVLPSYFLMLNAKHYKIKHYCITNFHFGAKISFLQYLLLSMNNSLCSYQDWLLDHFVGLTNFGNL